MKIKGQKNISERQANHLAIPRHESLLGLHGKFLHEIKSNFYNDI